MIRLANESDDEFILSLMHDESIWDHISDDNSVKQNSIDGRMNFLIAENDDSEKVGFFALKPINSICYEIHTVMSKKAWGMSIKYTAEVLAFAFNELGLLSIITLIPEGNTRARSLAERSGLTMYGYLEQSFLKNGELIGQYIFGVSKERFLCQ